MMQHKRFGLILVLLFFVASIQSFSFAQDEMNQERYLTGEYWKNQALTEMIPFWPSTIDEKNGGFFTKICREGSIAPSDLKYPRMISRLVFGFSTAFLLSGDERYLEYAKHGLTYLQQYGWDHQYGGWYSELKDNSPNISTKDLFDETYGNLGPVFYYYVTGDEQALDLVKKTHRLITEKAWDKQYGGYFGIVNRDWSVTESYKTFNSEIDTATAYLIYYYLCTKDPGLLEDLKNIGNVAIDHMYDPQTGYIRELFTRKWVYLDSYLGPNQIDIGHNLKTAWVLLRLYRLTGEKRYYIYARKIADLMMEAAWDKDNFGWYFSKNVNLPVQTDTEKRKCWWTQEEGNVMLLNLFGLEKDQRYLDYFQKSTSFWDAHMIDHRYKEVFAYTTAEGIPFPGLKGDLYKSAYHTMENALMNYLYTQLYVHKQTAELYFNLSAASNGIRHYVKIVESPDVIIKNVEINDKVWQNFNAKEGYVDLPQGKNMKVKVVFGINES
jgi:mannose/cellobiose epimerase-like protein (N-acyl-D-glucosamine 2-epimerase family)